MMVTNCSIPENNVIEHSVHGIMTIASVISVLTAIIEIYLLIHYGISFLEPALYMLLALSILFARSDF